MPSSKIKKIKIHFISLFLTLSGLSILPSYADLGPIPTPNFTTLSIKKLVAGYGSDAISKNLMNMAPTDDDLTIVINTAQAAYLLYPSSASVSLTQQLLKQSANLTDNSNNILALTWEPYKKSNPDVEQNPLNSIDINSLLQPISYNPVEEAAAKNVINALTNTLIPINTVNFNELLANLGGNKQTNLKIKLSEKPIKEYLATLRLYLTTQSIAAGNLYQLYTERQAIDPRKADPTLQPMLMALSHQTHAPVSLLKLENFMATRRILDKNWYENLIKENPATLQREQTELLAESLAESYHTRMTLERLLATMSVLVLELNSNERAQLQNQTQTILNSNHNSG